MVYREIITDQLISEHGSHQIMQNMPMEMYELLTSRTGVGSKARAHIKSLRNHEGLEAWRVIKAQLGKTDEQRIDAEYTALLTLPEMTAGNFKDFGAMLAGWESELKRFEELDREYLMGRPSQKKSRSWRTT